jgi:hypothetical protein
VQQKQGRVQPTMQLQGININDNEGLEREADMMGGKVRQSKSYFINPQSTNFHSENKPKSNADEGKAKARAGNQTSVINILQNYSKYPIQLLRIRLNDDDSTYAFSVLRQVKTSAEEDTSRTLPKSWRERYTPKVEKLPSEDSSTAFILGETEDIVFEGHGMGWFDFTRKMEGKNADDLAKIVFDIIMEFYKTADSYEETGWVMVKHLTWKGKVILLGCYTSPLAKRLAEKLKKLTGQAISVVGTKGDIHSHSGYPAPVTEDVGGDGFVPVDEGGGHSPSKSVAFSPCVKYKDKQEKILFDNPNHVDIFSWNDSESRVKKIP